MSLSFVTRSSAGARLTEVANTAANGDQAGVRYTLAPDDQRTEAVEVIPTEGSAKVVPSPKDDKTARPRRSGPYTYDWKMRRTGKRSYVYTAGNWTLTKTTGFKYHEWNPIQETIIPASGSTENKYYVWGNDLSGDLHGAGGVGGLLSMKYNGESYFYAYDGNGNVRALLQANVTTPGQSGIVERYAYDGFGRELTGSTLANASVNACRFSTKQADAETGMIYYSFRYYAADVGRWLNRDYNEENGGANLYEFCDNRIDEIDPLGLSGITWGGDGRRISDGPKYGNWGGRNWSGWRNPNKHGGIDGTAPPVDSSDECYMAHDKCYEKCDKLCGSSKNKCIEDCDKDLKACLAKLPKDPTKWPHPPPRGDEGSASRFKRAAKFYF